MLQFTLAVNSINVFGMQCIPIPVIDIFAGPGGLSEGFSRFPVGTSDDPRFEVKLSIEKDHHALNTLRLRSFVRHCRSKKGSRAYKRYLKGDIDKAALFASDKTAADHAHCEVLESELGHVPAIQVHERINEALRGAKDSVLIGGPPCQAYSLAGRSRMLPVLGEEAFEADPRHQLYREYLRILAFHEPIAFVFENVRGLLSSRLDGKSVFTRIRADLMDPGSTVDSPPLPSGNPQYTLFSVTERAEEGAELSPKQFVVKSELYGVPQNRHRVIILGIRNDHLKKTSRIPELLTPDPVGSRHVSEVLDGLPKLRSSRSRPTGDYHDWLNCLRNLESRAINGDALHVDRSKHEKMLVRISEAIQEAMIDDRGTGSSYLEYRNVPAYDPLKAWYRSGNSRGLTNHETRGHMASDLERYLFCSVFAEIEERTPSMTDFPEWLLPAHKNLKDKQRSSHFADRFRVQVSDLAATTITSHISKDGHYYIHPDPSQARSLTVREAARIQTFPDDYHFEGPRTEQYSQVGNAVPPYLAYQIAKIVSNVLRP
jgi:DNA (cytosine-5)-methyltransferase 1